MTAAPATSAPLLQATSISKSFPGVRALHNAQITVEAGRLNAVLGENGAGKSTLMNILAGVFPPDAGEIRINGEPVRFANPREASESGISIIHQELNLIPQLSVAENIFLGREPVTSLGLIDRRTMNQQAVKLLQRLGLEVDPWAPTFKLSVGAQQLIEIAKALSTNARVIIMDEPTSAISDQEVTALFRIVDELKRDGVGIIYITHKFDELPHIADDVTILRDGEFILASPYRSLSTDEMIRLMVGRELSELFPKSMSAPRDEVLRVEDLCVTDAQRPGRFLIQDISLGVRRGEVLGVFGLMGAGRTELLQAIFGLHSRSVSGQVFVGGQEVHIDSPAAAIRAGLALAPEDRKQEGLVLPLSVAANISLSSLKKTKKQGLLSPGKEQQLAHEYAGRLRIKTPSLRQQVRNLSGGNQQKVVLAKWLATNPKVLLLDEPTRGIDINSKREIYVLIEELASQGLGVVMVSSELPEILAIADRVVVLAEGRKTAEFSRSEASEERILKAALPARRASA
jgi:ABC-type sugar transport system ATPase subunit